MRTAFAYWREAVERIKITQRDTAGARDAAAKRAEGQARRQMRADMRHAQTDAARAKKDKERGI